MALNSLTICCYRNLDPTIDVEVITQSRYLSKLVRSFIGLSPGIIAEPIPFFLAKGQKNNYFVKKYKQEKYISSLFKCRLSKWKCQAFKFMIPFIIFRLNNSNSRATILDTVTLNGAARLQLRRCKPARSYCNSVTVHLSRTSFSCTHAPPLWWKNEVKQKFKERKVKKKLPDRSKT